MELSANQFRGVRHFARYMLSDGCLRLAPLRDAIWTACEHQGVGSQKMLTCILFRSGCWQVELLVIHPGSSSPKHRHNHCESADILLNGDLTGTVNGVAIGRPRGTKLTSNITRIPVGAWHGGATEKGLVCLSFQRWIGWEPTFIANDWEAYRGD